MDVNFSNPDFLPWLVPVGPLAAFFIIILATSRSKLVPATSHEYGGHHPDYDGMDVPVDIMGTRILSVTVGMIAILLALILSLIVVGHGLNPPQEITHFGEEIFGSRMDWMTTGSGVFQMGVMVDPLTVVTLFMVAVACTAIFIYSIGYMAHDPRQSRFFAFISLFAGAMMTLVVADNLLLMFIGWEIMGLCSYLLIGFWFEKKSAYEAAIKAFTTTRVADVIMLLGIAYLYAETGTLSFREILYNPDVLERLANSPAIIFGGISAAGLISIFLIIGTVGKSAQFPLHVWLPDAMEGPTPVSAMIHAAAMVSAGIYAIIRMYPLLSAGSDPHHGDLLQPMNMMAIVGSFTALFAATIAVAQNDVKRVLAYSTISQLGFMMAALGIGAYIAAAFHLIMHAFFKALLFMASGSVIHAMEHGEHHAHEHAEGHHHEAVDPQNMLNMGGLRHRIPVTWWTFLAGGLSLAGFPLLTAGFWSKDEILADAWHGLTKGFGAHALVFVLLALAAFLTAFYTMRQLGLTFWGEPRSEAAKHATLGGPRNIVSITMQFPLIVLAIFALVAGFVGVPHDFPLFGSIFSPEHNWFHHFVGPTLLAEIEPPVLSFNIVPVLFSFTVALGGLALGWWVYWRKPLEAGQPDPLEGMLGSFYGTLKNKWYVDELYGAVFVRPLQWFARVAVKEIIDDGIIDGVLHLIARVATWIGDLFKVLNTWLIDGVGDGIPRGIARFGFWFRRVQTGHAQQYLLFVAAAAIIIGIVFALSTGILASGG